MASGDKIVFKPSIELLRYYIYENDKFMKGTIDNPYIWICPDWFDTSDSIAPLVPEIEQSVYTFNWCTSFRLSINESGQQLYTLQFCIYDIFIPVGYGTPNSISITILHIKK